MAENTEQDDRTEEPTQRKLDEAIKRGDVAKSVEINTLFVLAAFTLGVMLLSPSLSRNLALDLRGYLMNAHLVPQDGAGLLAVAQNALKVAFAALLLPAAALSAAGLMGGALQHRPFWTMHPLKPQFSRVSPMSGLKRIFGREALVQFLKGLLKITTVGSVVALVIWGEWHRLESLVRTEPAGLLPELLALTLKLLSGVCVVFAFLAIGDAIYQRLNWLRRQRMTKRELKEEYKETEGNPEIKAKLKQIRSARVKRRMMAAVPTATVVITNPTHYAVALRYERGMAAPVCVAKGVDDLALRIREVAAEHRVAVVENPPLARALHATVRIDDEIPVEHYKAVAEVIGAILRLRRRPA